MKFARRDLLKFAGGAAAGFFLSPVPYKTLADVSIWTQNWSWLPTPVRGESKLKFTTCTLCAAGCGVQVRCAGDQPVGMAGILGHPISDGALCPLGLAGHQFPYHPLRATQALHRGVPVSIDDAAGAIRREIAKDAPGSVALLDGRPGRTASVLYRDFVKSVAKGIYVAAPSGEGATLDALHKLLRAPLNTGFGLDLEHTRTLLSFGAPVLDGWGAPGRVMKSRNSFRLIQVESRLSNTAALADLWLPVIPGAEAALALAIGGVIAEEAGDRDYPSMPLREAESITGIPEDTIRTVAAELMRAKPVIAIGGGDPAAGPLGNHAELAIASLNLLLGSVGVAGGILARREADTPDVVALDDVPDRSIRLLLIDEAGNSAIPWRTIAAKLAGENPLVVCMSAHTRGCARHADYLIPSPAYLESVEDVPTPFDAPTATFSLSAQLMPPPPGAVAPADFVARLGAQRSVAELRKARVEAIYNAGRGTLFSYATAKQTAVKELTSVEQLSKALNEGACWTDSQADRLETRHFTVPKEIVDVARQAPRLDTEFPLLLVAYGWRGATGDAPGTPLLSKLYQESGLRAGSRQAAIHPDTGDAFGLSDGQRAIVSTRKGSAGIRMTFDASVMPGALYVAAGPGDDGVLDICSGRATPAHIGKA